MANLNLPTPAQIEDVSRRIESATSLDGIKAIVEEWSAAATREGGVLYSGMLGGNVYSGTVAQELAAKLKMSIINDTPRGELLSNKSVEDSIRSAAARIFRDEFHELPTDAEKSAANFIFGKPDAPSAAPTSVENSLWGDASREFARSLRGKIMALVDNAKIDRVFAKIELPEALKNSNITELMGMTRYDAQNVFQRDGFEGVLLASRAEGETLAATLPETLRSAYPGIAETATRSLASDLRLAGGTTLFLATVGIDATQSVSRANDLAAHGNVPAADSEIVHFATRNLGILGGAALGTEIGGALGIESGPGALVTGLLGGVIGALGGNQIAKWYDESKINTQTDHTGKTWSINPLHPEQWMHRSGRSAELADAETTRELNFRATSTAAELAIGNPPTTRDPNVVPLGPGESSGMAGGSDWQRNPSNGQWTRSIAHFAGRIVYHTQEIASPARSKELDKSSGDIVAQNLAHSPQATMLRFEAMYIHNGWDKFGPMPPALTNTSPDHLVASDGKTYDLGKDGRWTNKDVFFGGVASDSIKAELDITRAALQNDLAVSLPALERLREQMSPSQNHKLNILQDSKEQQVGAGFEIHGTVHNMGPLVLISGERDGKPLTTLIPRQELLNAASPGGRDAIKASLIDGKAIDIKLTSQGLNIHSEPPQQKLQVGVRGLQRQNSASEISH